MLQLQPPSSGALPPAASSAAVCKLYYGEILQRWQLRHKRTDKAGSDRRHVEAAARRASLWQAERERLKKQMQLVERAHGKRQELLESNPLLLQNLQSRTLEAINRRTEQQEGLKLKLLEHFKKSARCRQELERRAAELRSRIEAREKQAHALRFEHLQRIRRKCVATAERTSLASTRRPDCGWLEGATAATREGRSWPAFGGEAPPQSTFGGRLCSGPAPCI
ncbi:hypothetical protein Efla_005642 [Eimeria flavescens]